MVQGIFPNEVEICLEAGSMVDEVEVTSQGPLRLHAEDLHWRTIENIKGKQCGKVLRVAGRKLDYDIEIMREPGDPVNDGRHCSGYHVGKVGPIEPCGEYLKEVRFWHREGSS